MNRIGHVWALLLLATLAFPAGALQAGDIDPFPGDLSIYLHLPADAEVVANVLFLVDTSAVMHTTTAAGGATILTQLGDALLPLVTAHRADLHFGLMEFGYGGHGGRLIYPVSDLSSAQALNEFTAALQSLARASSDEPISRPLAEALFDARSYFAQDRTATVAPLSGTDLTASPMASPCQVNVVILISAGESIGDDFSLLCETLPVIDADLDGHPGDICRAAAFGEGTHLVDDVARFAVTTDLSAALAGRQNLSTYTLLVSQEQSVLLPAAAEDGDGVYRQADDGAGIRTALVEMLSQVVGAAKESFSATRVPLSLANRTLSAARLYFGLFAPDAQNPWPGNLKKYGLSTKGVMLDALGQPALCSGAVETAVGCVDVAAGELRSDALSYWSREPDGAQVSRGGAGAVLLAREPSHRRLYANLSDNPDLTARENALVSTNLTTARLGLTQGDDAVQLIDYVYGFDAYDEDGDGDAAEIRPWTLGSIVHSPPAVVHYHLYPSLPENEADPEINQSVVYVGGNDGMLHAFRDADGQELWAFVPDNLLPHLMPRNGPRHRPLVDGPLTLYVYDHDRDGNVGPIAEQSADDRDLVGRSDNGQFDVVLLLFGQRRGGEAYYALDVTTPAAPKFLWKIDRSSVDENGNTLFPELGETWSQPNPAWVRNGTTVQLVAVIGAGYDPAEDSRYGAVAGYPIPLAAQPGAGAVASVENTQEELLGLRGRGIYLIALAERDALGVPQLYSRPEKIWSYSCSDNSRMSRPIPSSVTVLDADYDGDADRLYVADLAGGMWRLDISYPDKANWHGDLIFASAASSGRKMFQRPSVVSLFGSWRLAFASGDLAHPLNTAVTDRLYLLKDQGQNTVDAIDESRLVDVTDDLLQLESTTAQVRQTLLDRLRSAENYGWYIELNRLNQAGLAGGEKGLTAPIIFNHVAYFTTYMPDADPEVAGQSCLVGNPGQSFLYALDVRTGEAVHNFYESNDGESTDGNERAVGPKQKVLRREDRSVSLGSGYASGVAVLPFAGDSVVLIGGAGRLSALPTQQGNAVYPLYWKEW